MKKGIETLRRTVMKDCAEGSNCFNSKGCDQQGRIKCFHKYCDKYAWVLRRARHYQRKTGVDSLQILTDWETNRDYWYMNYYQEGSQPLIKGKDILLFDDWEKRGVELFGEDKKKWKYKCPSCNHIQTPKDFIKMKAKPENANFNCVGRFKKGIGCNWSLGGLFSIHKVTVVKDSIPHPTFEFG